MMKKTDKDMDSKVVIIPTYNEKENIEAIIRKVFSLEGGYHILVIDDGSPDGTASIVKKLREEFPNRPDSSGLLTMTMTTPLRWMLTSPTIPMICQDSMKPAGTAEEWL